MARSWSSRCRTTRDEPQAWAGLEDGVGPAAAVTTQGFHDPRIGQASVRVQ